MKKAVQRVFSLALAGAMCALSVCAVPMASAASAEGKYYPDYATFAAEQVAGQELNTEIVQEGAVLLKNQDNALPLSSSERDVTLFGAASVSPCYGGGGSGSAAVSSYQTQITPQMGMERAGFRVNQRVLNFYANEYLPNQVLDTSNSEIHYAYSEPSAADLAVCEESYALYGDAAVVMIYGVGSEGTDRLRNQYNDGTKYDPAHDEKDGHTSPGHAHALELTDSEIDLINYVTERFDKVIVVLNTSNVIECGWLEDNDKVDGILWIGNPGVSGFEAMGGILSGQVNPSGRTADVYPADLTKDPTWYNFGDNSQQADGAVYQAHDANGNKLAGLVAGRASSDEGIPFVEYEENVYYGYFWYETLAADNGFAPVSDGSDPYYNRTNGVVYPFGYGLSYTTFRQEIVNTAATGTLDADSVVTVQVRVHNTGSVAGKEVVQLYNTAPYYNGSIEKPAVKLVAFGKTGLLQPGESEIVTLTVEAKELASFDWNDKNGNGFAGYELEAGTYTLSVRTDSHTVIANGTITRTVAGTGDDRHTGILYDGSTDALSYNGAGLANAEAIFSQDDIYYSASPVSANGNTIVDYVTRDAGLGGLKQPAAPAVDTAKYAQETIDNIEKFNVFTPDMDLNSTDEDYSVWQVDAIPEGWTQGTGTADANGRYAITLKDLLGVEITDQKWEDFMNQLTLDEMISFMSCNPGASETIGLPRIVSQDGPAQLKGGSSAGTFWCCETMIATAWNTDLAYQQGIMVANEGMLKGVDGWYGNAMNIHRSAFGGRNFEYYSQDPIHNAYIAAAVTRGATDKGLVTYIKHFAVNDLETCRESNDGIVVWCTEQAMREIYFKPFEYAIKYGNSNGVMTSYNRIGAVSADANYRLMNTLAREEWGFTGNFVSDANAVNARASREADGTYASQKYQDLVIRAGCVSLSGVRTTDLNGISWDASKRDGKGSVVYGDSQVEVINEYYAIRTIAQRFLYTELNDSFCFHNGIDTGAFTGSEIQKYTNQNVNESIAVSAAALNASCVSYAVTDGSLPAGLRLTADGTITGAAAEEGSFRFTVAATADYWIASEQQFTLNISSPFSIGDNALDSLKVGSEVDTQVDFALTGEYDTVEFSAEGLPEGLSLAADGTLYGTPAAEGEYSFTILVNATKGEGRQQQRGTFTKTYAVSVAGEPALAAAVPAPAADGGSSVSYGPVVGVSALVGIVCAALGTVVSHTVLRRRENDKAGKV